MEFNRIYTTGKPSEFFEETYAAIYEACSDNEVLIQLEIRLMDFFESKILEVHSRCKLKTCSYIRNWLRDLINYIVISREISDLLLYYNRFSKIHSLDLGFYILACYLLDLYESLSLAIGEPSRLNDARQRGSSSPRDSTDDGTTAPARFMMNPLLDWLKGENESLKNEALCAEGAQRFLWTICHAHKCMDCRKLMQQLMKDLTSVLHNWPSAFLIVYKKDLSSEWRSLRQAIGPNRIRRNYRSRLLFLKPRRARRGRISLPSTVIKPVADYHKEGRYHALGVKINFPGLTTSNRERYVYWYMSRTSEVLKNEINFAECFDIAPRMLRVINEVWSDTFTKGSDKLIKVIDWMASSQKRKLVLKGISWFSLNIQNWIELSTYLRSMVFNDLFESVLLSEEEEFVQSSEAIMLSKLLRFKDLFRELRGSSSSSSSSSFKSLMAQSMKDYFTSSIESSAQSAVMKLLIGTLGELGIEGASESKIINEFVSFVKLDTRGRMQRKVIDSVLALDSLFDPKERKLSHREEFIRFLPMGHVHHILERITRREIIPDQLNVLTLAKFYHKPSRLMRNIPEASTQIRKWFSLMFVEKNRVLELALDLGRCLFMTRSGEAIQCSTGAGIILDCWNHMNSTGAERLFDDKMLIELSRVTRMSPEIFEEYYSEISDHLNQGSKARIGSLKTEEARREGDRFKMIEREEDPNGMAILDCNLAYLFKNRKDDWLSESEIMTSILLDHPKHFGVRIETFRNRLAALNQRDVIEMKHDLFRWAS